MDKVHVENNAVHEAIFDVSGAFIALVGDDLHGIQFQILREHCHEFVQLSLITVRIGDTEVGEHVALDMN